MTDLDPRDHFTPGDLAATRVPLKVGILGTVNAEGLPHLTMISTLQAGDARRVVWGQFTEGLSKAHVCQNPRTGFLIMTLDKRVWRGQATFTHTAQQGADYDWYNNVPMFRYNAYFGVHTVYYMTLESVTGPQALPMGRIVSAALQTLLARSLSRQAGPTQALNAWTQALFNKLDNLKFIGYLDGNGYPVILPAIQAQAGGSSRVVFALGAFGKQLGAIPAGTPLAVFAMSLDMETVLVRGSYRGVKNLAGLPCGVVEVDWVYNAMPPVPGQIYPPLEIQPVTHF